MEKCPFCGESFQKIGTHWQWNPDHRPSLSDHQFELLTGVLMGDGSIQQYRSGRKPHMDICMVNKDFLVWLDSELEIFSTGVCLRRTSEEIKKNKQGTKLWEDSTFQDQYRLTTRAHPQLEPLNDWYSSGKKTFPTDLTLTPTILKMWYVTDGNYHKGNVRFTATNENNNKQKVISYFDEIGIDASWNGKKNIRLHRRSIDDFFSYIGEPVVGFEHKWPQNE